MKLQEDFRSFTRFSFFVLYSSIYMMNRIRIFFSLLHHELFFLQFLMQKFTQCAPILILQFGNCFCLKSQVDLKIVEMIFFFLFDTPFMYILLAINLFSFTFRVAHVAIKTAIHPLTHETIATLFFLKDEQMRKKM